MGELAGFSGKIVIRKLGKIGYVVIRMKGSHARLWNDNGHPPVTVPMHKELRVGLLRAIIKQVGLSAEEFLAL